MTTAYPPTSRTTPSRNPGRVAYDRATVHAVLDEALTCHSATRPPTRKGLAATTVLRLPLVEVSVKVRSGPPNDDAEDLGLPHWTGVLPLTTAPGDPVPAPDLATGREVPAHVRAWCRRAVG